MATNLASDTRATCSSKHVSNERHVYVIDDNRDLRMSLHFLLATCGVTAWPFAAAEDFLDHLPTLKAGPILLDVRMPGMNGLQTLSALRERDLQWPVVMMTAHGDVAIAVRAMKLGAIEFLEKPFASDVLEVALAQAFDVLEATQNDLMVRSEARQLLDTLSKRETEVVDCLATGIPNKLVAHRLGLSVRTVEMHRRNAMAKLGRKSVAEIVALVAAAELP